MRITSVSSLLLALALLNSSSCSSGPSSWDQMNSSYFSSLEPADSLAKVKIPVLRSPAYEAKWGPPKIRISVLGGYELSYANPAQPFDRLVIYGSARPFPVLKKAPDVSGEKMIKGELTGVSHPQRFRSVLVAGQSVKWFQESTSGGADGAYYSTEGFTLKSGFGNPGFYRIVVEGGNEMDAEVARRFASAKF